MAAHGHGGHGPDSSRRSDARGIGTGIHTTKGNRVSPWHIGPTGNRMPPTGTSTPYGTPGHGQQWPYAQSYSDPPGYYPLWFVSI